MITEMCLKCSNYIIKLANEKNKFLTSTILQKILFYSYVEYARQFQKPMFKDEFYAWERGPVIPEIYSVYSMYQTGKMFEKEIKNKEPLTEDKQRIIANTFVHLIDKEIEIIVERTHQEGSPWGKHYTNDLFVQLTTDYCKISFDEILEFYNKTENYKYLISF